MNNPLADLIPARYRRYVYAVAALAALVYGVYQASGGDWKEFVAALFATLIPLLAASNTPASRPEIEEAAEELVEDEGQYFDGHGDEAEVDADDEDYVL